MRSLMYVMMVLGVFVWAGIATWLVRLGLGWDHLGRGQVVTMLICGPAGGIAAWYFAPRFVRALAATGKGS